MPLIVPFDDSDRLSVGRQIETPVIAYSPNVIGIGEAGARVVNTWNAPYVLNDTQCKLVLVFILQGRVMNGMPPVSLSFVSQGNLAQRGLDEDFERGPVLRREHYPTPRYVGTGRWNLLPARLENVVNELREIVGRDIGGRSSSSDGICDSVFVALGAVR